MQWMAYGVMMIHALMALILVGIWIDEYKH
jgi:hypothetical protein